MKTLNCCNCGTKFAMEDVIYDARLEDGDTFTCPNGHNQHFTESENKKLRRELKRARDSRDNHKKWWRERGDEIDRLVRQRSALRGVVTKMQKKLYPERFKE